MSATVPYSKFSNLIGKIGEAIAEKYFKENDIIVVNREFILPTIGARVDFIITRKADYVQKFTNYFGKRLFSGQVGPNYNLIPKSIIKKFSDKEHKNWTTQKLIEVRDQLQIENPGSIVSFWGVEKNSLIFFDQNKCFKGDYEFIKDNYCLVEVKSSIGKYPKITGNALTPSQKNHKYYDYILRLKIDTDIKNGFEGTLHSADLQLILSDHKLKAD